MKQKSKYTKGYEDIERAIEQQNDQEKKKRREEWLRNNFNKSNKNNINQEDTK